MTPDYFLYYYTSIDAYYARAADEVDSDMFRRQNPDKDSTTKRVLTYASYKSIMVSSPTHVFGGPLFC